MKVATDETEAAKAMHQLAEEMRSVEGEHFEHCLQGLSQLFKKGYTSVFMTYVDLMRKMMNHFTRLGKHLEVKLYFILIGRRSRSNHRISYALRALDNRWADQGKPQILLPFHPQIPAYCFPDRLLAFGVE